MHQASSKAAWRGQNFHDPITPFCLQTGEAQRFPLADGRCRIQWTARLVSRQSIQKTLIVSPVRERSSCRVAPQAIHAWTVSRRCCGNFLRGTGLALTLDRRPFGLERARWRGERAWEHHHPSHPVKLQSNRAPCRPPFGPRRCDPSALRAIPLLAPLGIPAAWRGPLPGCCCPSIPSHPRPSILGRNRGSGVTDSPSRSGRQQWEVAPRALSRRPMPLTAILHHRAPPQPPAFSSPWQP